MKNFWLISFPKKAKNVKKPYSLRCNYNVINLKQIEPVSLQQPGPHLQTWWGGTFLNKPCHLIPRFKKIQQPARETAHL